jgi:hypothetical protein
MCRDNGDEIGSVAMTGLSMEEFSCNGISFVELLTRVEREPLLQHEGYACLTSILVNCG